MKIVTVVGARPQFIKAAAFSRAVAREKEIREVIIHTGQHFDENMSDIFFNQMGIPRPDYHFNIHGLSHGAMTGQMLGAIEEVLVKEKPHYLLVYGDTNSTLAGALAARKLNVNVIHIEAGLRSFNMTMPEEINRILTDRISDLLFCPTETAVNNLKTEGFENFNCSIYNTGDIMFDSMRLFGEEANKYIENIAHLTAKPFALCTIHRAENTDNPARLKQIVEALNTLAEKTTVVTPLHPRTRKKMSEFGLQLNTAITPPLGYFDMLNLLKSCEIVLTDSGGLQKEAFFNNKFCITLREETEWVELAGNGYNILAGCDSQRIADAYNHFMNSSFGEQPAFYGDGNCAGKVIEILKN